ncbi:unnamed protein product [Periconia digitata]|uniref:Uncharacterized protein n=1 Tax=Periconia digitata TaxID=1303443 RepID=A0A9W4U4L0_9PLEO|nr:unnamed protein product [Periconia digitata]
MALSKLGAKRDKTQLFWKQTTKLIEYTVTGAERKDILLDIVVVNRYFINCISPLNSQTDIVAISSKNISFIMGKRIQFNRIQISRT